MLASDVAELATDGGAVDMDRRLPFRNGVTGISGRPERSRSRASGQMALPNLAVLDQGVGASRRRAAGSRAPCGRAAWAPVPPVAPVGRLVFSAEVLRVRSDIGARR